MNTVVILKHLLLSVCFSLPSSYLVILYDDRLLRDLSPIASVLFSTHEGDVNPSAIA